MRFFPRRPPALTWQHSKVDPRFLIADARVLVAESPFADGQWLIEASGGSWSVELLDSTNTRDNVDLGVRSSESGAKAAAERYERKHRRGKVQS